MQYAESHTQHLLSFQQMSDVASGEIAAGGTAAPLVDGARVAFKFVVQDIHRAVPCKDITVPRIAGRHDTVKEINAAVNAFHNIIHVCEIAAAVAVIENFYFPIPSLSYQRSVVELLYNLIPHLQSIEASKNQLAKYVESAKQKLLEGKYPTFKEFLADILPILQVGIPILTYTKDGKQNKVLVTEKFIEECKQQVVKDFYGE